MSCLHKRIHKFIKKNLDDKILGYLYCCFDCKEIFETYGLEPDEDLENKILDTRDMVASYSNDNDKSQTTQKLITEMIHGVIREETEIARRKLDGEIPFPSEQILKQKIKRGEKMLKEFN